MSHDPSRASELAALVAIGAATELEHAELDRLLHTDATAVTELDAFTAVAASLADSLEPMAPPAGGFEALSAAIAAAGAAPGPKATIAGPPPVGIAPPKAPTHEATTPEYAEEKGGEKGGEGAEIISLAARRRQRLLGGALGISLAAAAAFLFLWLQERDRAAGQVADAQAEKKRAIDAVRTDAQTEIDRIAKQLKHSQEASQTLAARFETFKAPKLTLATMTAEGGNFAHVVAESDGRRWLVVAEGLPGIDADKDYQMWFVPEGGAPVSAGLLRSGPGGVLSATTAIPDELVGTKLRPAISLEPKGGSPQPTAVKLIGEPI